MINHYPVDEIIRETYCTIQRIEIYLVDSAICLLHDWDHIDNDDQAMVSEIKHSVSNPLRKLNNYDKAIYYINNTREIFFNTRREISYLRAAM